MNLLDIANQLNEMYKWDVTIQMPTFFSRINHNENWIRIIVDVIEYDLLQKIVNYSKEHKLQIEILPHEDGENLEIQVVDINETKS